MAEGSTFQRVYGETEKIGAANKVRRVVVCSGKVYYDLLQAREDRGIDDVAILRVEQLYPWPKETLAREFAKYKNSSQYVLMNAGMDLAAFKWIYFWEFFHRLFGRVIGLAFLLPLIWFGLKRAIPGRLTGRLVILLFLGAMQGLIGWLMVKSGLVDRVNVQPVMLAAHLAMALLLLSALVWTALDCLEIHRGATAPLARVTPFALLTGAVLFFQIIWGALTAGMRAGQVSNTWPLMNDHFVPDLGHICSHCCFAQHHSWCQHASVLLGELDHAIGAFHRDVHARWILSFLLLDSPDSNDGSYHCH
jgi:heme A synthase